MSTLRLPGLVWLALGTTCNFGRVISHWWVFEALTFPLLLTAIAVVLVEPQANGGVDGRQSIGSTHRDHH